MDVNIRGVDAEIKRIKELINKNVSNVAMAKISVIMSSLIKATPVDTGRARGGWNLQSTAKGFKISNDVPYIEELNNGHSQQAPSHFIESVLLSHGKAIGAIVTKTPD